MLHKKKKRGKNMELKAVKNETKKEYLTKKEQYQKIKNKAGKMGIGTILMFMASNTSYALPANVTEIAGIAPFDTTPVWVKIVGLAQWILMFAGIISFVITILKFIIKRKEEDVKKKIEKNIIITTVIWSVLVVISLLFTCFKKCNMW